MKLRRSILAVAATALLATAANAADIPVFVPAPAPVVVVPAPAGFDWAGLYVGVAGGHVFDFYSTFPWNTVEGVAGFNLMPGNLVIGARVHAGAWIQNSGAGPYGEALGRFGAALGGSDRLLVYAVGGGGFYGPGFSDWHLSFGGGVELGIGSRLSVFAETRGEWFFEPGIYPHVEAGINFHFGN